MAVVGGLMSVYEGGGGGGGNHELGAGIDGDGHCAKVLPTDGALSLAPTLASCPETRRPPAPASAFDGVRVESGATTSASNASSASMMYSPHAGAVRQASAH